MPHTLLRSESCRLYAVSDPFLLFADYSSCIFTADKRDNEFGFELFTTYSLLEMAGRGYLKNDVLEIRTIIKVDAVSNMAPPPPIAHMNTGKNPHTTIPSQVSVSAQLYTSSILKQACSNHVR